MQAVALPCGGNGTCQGALKGLWEVQARGGLNRGSPASERGDCSWPNEGARGIRPAGVTTAATSWALTCERQWPLWHGNCCSGVSGAEPWSRFIAMAVALALVKPRSHPAQWIRETSRPTVSNSTKGSRPSRLPVPDPDTVTPTFSIILPVDASQQAFARLCISNNVVRSEGTRRAGIGLHLHGRVMNAENSPLIDSSIR